VRAVRSLDDVSLSVSIMARCASLSFSWAMVCSGFGKSGNLARGTQLYLLEILKKGVSRHSTYNCRPNTSKIKWLGYAQA
jgi:hypothetical protein